jgi:hypothetical protein
MHAGEPRYCAVMRIVPAVEQDSGWERFDAVYRVYLFSGGGSGGSWDTDTYDVSEADVDEVMAWAESKLGPGDLYSVALREGHGEDRGLIWLAGFDINDTPTDERERRIYARMLERRDLRG